MVSQMIIGDCIQILSSWKTKGFDCIFLDPPYFEWEGKAEMKPNHNVLSALCAQLLKPNGSIWLCGTQPQLAKDWHYWNRFFRLNFELIAYKNAGTPPISTKRPIPIHENIWCLWRKEDSLRDLKVDIRRVARKGKTVKAKTGGKRMSTRYGYKWHEWRINVKYPKSVMKVPKISVGNPEYLGHPAQKPLELMYLIIEMATEPGDWILDPFAGTGTTLIAAEQLGRNCIGIELNPEYARMWLKRRQKGVELSKWLNTPCTSET